MIKKLDSMFIRLVLIFQLGIQVALNNLENYLNTGSFRRRKLAAQATIEFILIGGIMVVIIIGLLLTVFRPQMEQILNKILSLINGAVGN